MKYVLVLLCTIFSTSIFSQSFDIYVSDAGNFNNPPWQILKFDANGQNPQQFINTNLNWPQDILFIEDSNTVLISNLGSGLINKHDATTGTFISTFASGIGGPTRMKIGPDSLLYVLQWTGNGMVRRYDLAGNFLGDFTSVAVNQSIGLDWDVDGNLYVSSFGGALVRKFDTAGVDQGVYIGTFLAGPTNIWFDTNGDLLVADYSATSVKRFDTYGNLVSNFITGLGQCEGVAIYPNGNILIGNGANSSVKLFDSTGTYISDFISSGSGNLLNPNAVVLRDAGPVGISELENESYQIFLSNTGTEFVLNQEISNKLKKLEVYNTEGKLIELININNIIWSARNLIKGNYFVKATLQSGKIIAEQILVI